MNLERHKNVYFFKKSTTLDDPKIIFKKIDETLSTLKYLKKMTSLEGP